MAAWGFVWSSKTSTRTLKGTNNTQEPYSPKCKTPWLQVLASDWCLVRLLDGPVRKERSLLTALNTPWGKFWRFWSASQLICPKEETRCSHQDSARCHWHSRWYFGQRETVWWTMTYQSSVYIWQPKTTTWSSMLVRFNSWQESESSLCSFLPQMPWVWIQRKLTLWGK